MGTDQCQSSGLLLPVLDRRNTAASSEVPSSSENLLWSSDRRDPTAEHTASWTYTWLRRRLTSKQDLVSILRPSQPVLSSGCRLSMLAIQALLSISEYSLQSAVMYLCRYKSRGWCILDINSGGEGGRLICWKPCCGPVGLLHQVCASAASARWQQPQRHKRRNVPSIPRPGQPWPGRPSPRSEAAVGPQRGEAPAWVGLRKVPPADEGGGTGSHRP